MHQQSYQQTWSGKHTDDPASRDRSAREISLARGQSLAMVSKPAPSSLTDDVLSLLLYEALPPFEMDGRFL